MFFLFTTLWVVWEIKYILFWIYLWQLKEYHFGRFADHFRTHKGKKLLFDFFQIFKLFSILALFSAGPSFFTYFFPLLFLVYLGEFFVFLRAILSQKIKAPVKTIKSIFLVATSFAVAVLFFIWAFDFVDTFQVTMFLVFDVLTPIIVSVIVLIFQPFFVVLRTNILKKAGKKLSEVRKTGNLTVIAISGSYGKTTTKEFLTTVLSKKYSVLSTSKHQNSEVGIAKCILNNLRPGHKIFIAEVGAYNKGKVREVCSMLKPKIGIITGVNEQHLALFGSLKNLLSAEGGGELAAALPKDGLLAVNGDNKYCLDLYKRLGEQPSKKIYSLSNKIINSDIWADSIVTKRDRVSFLALNKTGDMGHFTAKVLGKHNVQNLLAVILVARELGMSFGDISDACRAIRPEQAGMVLLPGKHGIDVLDSSYSANPDGVFADLDHISMFHQKKVVIMPSLIELGKKSPEIHEKIGRKIAGICGLAIITSRDWFEDIKRGAMEAGMLEKSIILCDNPNDIYSMVTLFCKSGDAVLLEGRVPQGLINLLTA